MAASYAIRVPDLARTAKRDARLRAMAPRFLILLALLGAAVLGWLLLGDGEPESSDTLDLAERDESDEPAGPGLRAEGRPDVGTRRPAPKATPTDTGPVVGEPKLDELKVMLRGVIVGADGRRIAGARVRVLLANGEVLELVTESDGSFRFRGMPGRYRVLVDGGEDGVAWAGALVLGAEGATRPNGLMLQAPATLTVTLRATDGPATDLAIRLVSDDDTGPPPREARSDDVGTAILTDVVPGRYTIEVETEDGSRHRKRTEPKAGESLTVAMFLAPTRPVTGSVRRGRADGPGVGQATLTAVVRIGQDGTDVERVWTTDYAGAFALDLPRGAIQQLLVEAEGDAPLWLRPFDLPATRSSCPES